jgi:hypothetical protein
MLQREVSIRRPESGGHLTTGVSRIFRGGFGFVSSKQLIVDVTKV